MTIPLCVAVIGALGLAQGRPKSQIATFSTLPSLGNGSEALAVDEMGTTIVGYAWDKYDRQQAVKWTLRDDGSWSLASLPWPPGVSSTIARGINNFGDVAGNDFPSTSSRAIVWPGTGGFNLVGCGNDSGPATVYGISADAQVAVGLVRPAGTAVPSIWRLGSCRESLPGAGGVYATNRDGTILGGGGPVRWRNLNGQWLIEQLDSRRGVANSANAAGDLAGYVVVPCSLQDGCDRAVVWYIGGGLRELGTLGGEQSWARGINSSGEVVGGSTSPMVGNTAYFWSESLGMVQLPFTGRWAAANALSNVRPDGTRLVVGMNSRAEGAVWIVRNP